MTTLITGPAHEVTMEDLRRGCDHVQPQGTVILLLRDWSQPQRGGVRLHAGDTAVVVWRGGCEKTRAGIESASRQGVQVEEWNLETGKRRKHE